MVPIMKMHELAHSLRHGRGRAAIKALVCAVQRLLPNALSVGGSGRRILTGLRLSQVFGIAQFPAANNTTTETTPAVLTPAERLRRLALTPWPDHQPHASHASHTPPVTTRGAFVSASYRNNAGMRRYKLYIPSVYHGKTLPLIVMLHGCTQNPDDFAAGTRMNELAEEFGCFVAYPAQDHAANGRKCWNWYEAAHQRRDQGEPSLIAGLTREIIRQHAVDTQRIYVAGLSAGGAMAAVMGATYPDLYAAVGIHSGLPYAAACDFRSALDLMRRGPILVGRRADDDVRVLRNVPQLVPTIVFHGDCDVHVHPRNGDHAAADWTDVETIVERGRVPHGHAYTRTVLRDKRRHSVLEQWQVHGAGHAWSGGSRHGSYTDPRGPDATREMVRFFYEHSLPYGGALRRWFGRGPGLRATSTD